MKRVIDITPRTRVGELLESYPELEDALIGLSPAFEKLRNPLLRRTIARVATLQQVAAVGNVPLEQIINTLRRNAGQSEQHINSEENPMKQNTPGWFNQQSVTETLDAREMLQRGEHPMAIVLGKAQGMQSGMIYELITSFVPMPLIDKVKGLGLESYTETISGEEVHTYFYKY